MAGYGVLKFNSGQGIMVSVKIGSISKTGDCDIQFIAEAGRGPVLTRPDSSNGYRVS